MTTDPIDLASYAFMRQARTQTSGGVAPVNLSPEVREARVAGIGGSLTDYARMYGSGDDSIMGRFFEISSELSARLTSARSLLDQRDLLSADDELTFAKAAAAELFMVRIANDAIALVASKIFQVLASATDILDNPDRLVLVEVALARIRMAPLMSFEQASEVVDPLDEFAGDILGYSDLANELLGE